MSKQDIRKVLRQLGKEARCRQQEEAAQVLRQQKEELDFSAAIGQVTALKSSNRVTVPSDRKSLKRRQETEEMASDQYFYVSESNEYEPPRSFCKNGRGTDDVRRLMSGHWPLVARLDLHGYTCEDAQQMLNKFVAEVRRRGVCAEIVHGSGLGSKGFVPVLKNLVRRWLMAHPDVLAYTEPHGGNDGAVRVLLRKRKEGNGR